MRGDDGHIYYFDYWCFDYLDRDEFWSSRDLLLGRVIEVQADAVTQNQDGSYSLRFPRFVRFRGFEAGEKM